MKRRRIPDLTNDVFGRLKVLYRTSNIGRHLAYQCECACGAFPVVRAMCLFDGATKSCGCLRRELAVKKIESGICERVFKHGHAKRNALTKEYHCWENFKCQGKSVPDFPLFLQQVGFAPNRASRLYQQPDGSFQWS